MIDVVLLLRCNEALVTEQFLVEHLTELEGVTEVIVIDEEGH